MKKLFRMAMVCALAGATLLYTGCTKDYSEDLSRMEKKVSDNETSIKTLNDQVGTINNTIKELQEADKKANSAIEKLQGQIGSLKESDVKDLKDQLTSLKSKVEANESAIESIKSEYAKKSYVDGELAKKADKTFVEETLKNYATVKALADSIGALRGELMLTNQAVFELKSRLSDVADSVQTNAEDIATLQDELTSAKNDIIKAQGTADEALDSAKSALSKAAAIEEALKLYADREEVKTLIHDSCDVIRAEIDAVDKALRETLKADSTKFAEALNNLQGKVSDALGAKVDTTTFNEYKLALEDRFSGIEKNLNKVFNRVQSLVYVPEYNDSKITLDWSFIMPVSPDPDQIFSGDNWAIEGPSNVKYRVYGEDASTIAASLVAAVNAGNDSLLTFDIVRVRTRALGEDDDVKLVVKSAKVDDLNPDVIDLTVVPSGFEDSFYFFTWWKANRTSLSQKYPQLLKSEFLEKLQALTEVPAYSVSLVLTDKESSKLITSEYDNVVPAQILDADIIFANIYNQDDEVVTFNPFAEKIDVEYIDTLSHAVLENHYIGFTYRDEVYSYEQLDSMGFQFEQPVGEIATLYNEDFAVDPSKVDTTYFQFAKDEESVPVTCSVKLSEVNAAGVRCFDHVFFTYKFGHNIINAGSLVRVVPAQASLTINIQESDTLAPFTWNYDLDAASDADSLLYSRDTIYAVYDAQKIADTLAMYGLKISDFSHKVADTVTYYTVEDGLMVEDDTLEIVPFFNEGVLSANVKNFDFANEEYAYVATYYFPDAQNAAVEVTVKGSFTTADRSHEPVVITLPDSQYDYYVDLNETAEDTLKYATVAPRFADNSLSDEQVKDAFSKRYKSKVDTLYMTSDGEDVNTPASALVITPAADEEEVLVFSTSFDVNNNIAKGVIDPYASFKSNVVLWYGQEVIVKKTMNFNVDGIFDYQRIPEYVAANAAGDGYLTKVQPKWSPKAATTDFSVPVTSYDVNKVLLDQHFRIVDSEGESVTDLQGNIKQGYEFLERVFKLEEDGEQVDTIADPRGDASLAKGVIVENDILSYYSESAQEDVVGNLYIVNATGSKVALTTSFNRTTPVQGVEDYRNYKVVKFDPLKELVYDADTTYAININNSQTLSYSIYQFLSLNDKRDHELIDSENGWVVGNDLNGFAAGKKVQKIYGLVYSNEMEYVSEVSDETKERIKFNKTTGVITFDNKLQTQLAQDIYINLKVMIDYPWGDREATVKVKFYNKPVGE